MSALQTTILPFTLSDRWIVTVESERRLVRVRHRTRWYAVARRKGHEERRHWCASREDALIIAEWQRQAFDRLAWAEEIQAYYDSAPDWKRAEIDRYLAELKIMGDRESGEH